MQNTTTTTDQTSYKTALKIYKSWVLKAHNAAKEAEKKAVQKEQYPQYIAAENLAKTALIKLNRFALILILLFTLANTTTAQNAVKTKDGNYTAIKSTGSSKEDKNTGKTYTDNNGIKYPVIESEKGKLYYIRTSKAGNTYKCYLKF